MEKERAENEFS